MERREPPRDAPAPLLYHGTAALLAHNRTINGSTTIVGVGRVGNLFTRPCRLVPGGEPAGLGTRVPEHYEAGLGRSEAQPCTPCRSEFFHCHGDFSAGRRLHSEALRNFSSGAAGRWWIHRRNVRVEAA